MQSQMIAPPSDGGEKRAPQLVPAPAGQSPPQAGGPGEPHGVLPIGRQPQLLSGDASPKPTHSSPAGHVPLHIGFDCPHGVVGPPQWQPEKPATTHVSPAAHAPAHSGKVALPQAGKPRRLASEQSGSDGAAAFAPTNRPASFVRMLAPSKRAQFLRFPVVTRSATRVVGAASARPACLERTFSTFPWRSRRSLTAEGPPGADGFFQRCAGVAPVVLCQPGVPTPGGTVKPTVGSVPDIISTSAPPGLPIPGSSAEPTAGKRYAASFEMN